VVLGLEDIELVIDGEESKDQSDDNAVIAIKGEETMDIHEAIQSKTLDEVVILENGHIVTSSGHFIGRLIDKVSFESKYLDPPKDENTKDQHKKK